MWGTSEEILGLLIAGNLLSALTPGYGVLMTGRVVAALPHGAFFGIGSVVATDLVAPSRRAAAITLMFTGLTVANVLGVPFGTALGQHLGWRSTFWAVTVLGAVGFATVPMFQTRMLDQAAPAPALASAANIAAFNLGNAVGAWLGGLVIDAGLGYTAPNGVGALLATVGLGVAWASGRLDRRPTPSVSTSRDTVHSAA